MSLTSDPRSNNGLDTKLYVQGSDNDLDTKCCVHFLILDHNDSYEHNNPTIMFIESSVREHLLP